MFEKEIESVISILNNFPFKLKAVHLISCVLLFATASFVYAENNQSLSDILSIIDDSDSYEIKDNYGDEVQLIFNFTSSFNENEKELFTSNMVINRYEQENHYSFIGQMSLSLAPEYLSVKTEQIANIDFNYSFSIKNGVLFLPDELDPQVKTIHQALFRRLAEIIQTTENEEYGYKIYYEWLPLATDLSLAITDVEIQEVECHDEESTSELLEKLTPNKIKQYFELSTEYTYINSYHFNDFDIHGCWIWGELKNHNRKMNYRIDLGGIGYLNGRVFGCAKGRCDVLDIDMGTDGMLAGE